MHILIAEDDKDMRKIISLYLQKEGYEVSAVSNGREAVEFLTEHPADLVLMDWMMPMQDGIRTCEEIRALRLPVKILMLTARGENEDEIRGLTCGADDYLRKPFDIQVLLLRIRKLCRTESQLSCGEIVMNTDTLEVTRRGTPVELTRTEYELLRMFLANQRQVLTRELLLDRVWGPDYEGDTRTVDTAVRRLRKKIGDDAIRTRIGLGYVMGDLG